MGWILLYEAFKFWEVSYVGNGFLKCALMYLHIQVLIVLLTVAFLSMYVKIHVYAACKIVIIVFLRVM